MKKVLSLALIILLCPVLCACDSSGTGNPDHDYVIALMEKGDYAMAIQVLEHLREQSGGSPAPAVPVETAQPTAEPTPQPIVLTELQQVAVDTVVGFMAEKGKAMIRSFEDRSGTRAQEPKVVNVMEYHLADYDDKGGVAHCLMIALEADIYAGDGFFDGLQLLVDLDTGTVYNSAELDMDLLLRGEPANRDELNTFLLNGYFSHLMFGEGIWTSHELREEFSEDDLTVINDALWK